MLKNKSLKTKFRIINEITFAIIAVLLLVGIIATINGMEEFGRVLDTNQKTRNFWNAIISENKEFNDYINDEETGRRDRLSEAENNTYRILMELPFDYSEQSINEYTQTQSIRNAYENFKYIKEAILNGDNKDNDYMTVVADYYTTEQYLENYAANLQTLTVEQGNIRYEKKKKLFYIIPGICAFTGIMVIIFFSWLKKFIQKSVLKPVLFLSGEAKKIANNDFSGEVPKSYGGDEIAVLINAFADMKEATKNNISNIEEKHQMEKQLIETRYQMLKNQINPHFLFNTLNLIASTAQIEDADNTEKMIVTLSRLFRYNLKSQAAVMPLEQELKVVSDYMYLQQIRFGKRIQYITDISEETKQIMVPSYVLQPIVENAIIHGLSKSAKGGKIIIRSWIKEDVTWISVVDTGDGMDSEMLQNIRSAISIGTYIPKKDEELDTGGTGIGLCNIAERVRSIYKNSEISIYSKKDHGTAVQICLSLNDD